MQTSLRNPRGAVMLLAVYFSAITLLLLHSLGLQRALTETRAAKVHTASQQAFWLAEAGLEAAIGRLHTQTHLGELTAQPLTLPGGQAELTAALIASEVLSPTQQRLAYQITSTGTTAAGQRARVQATVTQTGAVRGAWARGPIKLMDLLPAASQFAGDLRSGVGSIAAIQIIGEVEFDGALQIAPSGTLLAPYDSHIMPTPEESTQGWGEVMGIFDGSMAMDAFGISLKKVGCGAPCEYPTVATEASVGTLDLVGADAPPYDAASCNGHLTVTTPGEQRIIADGDPLDRTPAGDGLIDLCLAYVKASKGALPGVNPKLIFTAPTRVYLTGADAMGMALVTHDFYAVEAGHLVPAVAPLIPNGVQVIVTGQPADQPTAGAVNIASTRFSGSIYAPASYVSFTPTFADGPIDAEVHLNSLVSFETFLSALPMYSLWVDGRDYGSTATPTEIEVHGWRVLPAED